MVQQCLCHTDLVRSPKSQIHLMNCPRCRLGHMNQMPPMMPSHPAIRAAKVGMLPKLKIAQNEHDNVLLDVKPTTNNAIWSPLPLPSFPRTSCCHGPLQLPCLPWSLISLVMAHSRCHSPFPSPCSLPLSVVARQVMDKHVLLKMQFTTKGLITVSFPFSSVASLVYYLPKPNEK